MPSECNLVALILGWMILLRYLQFMKPYNAGPQNLKSLKVSLVCPARYGFINCKYRSRIIQPRMRATRLHSLGIKAPVSNARKVI